MKDSKRKLIKTARKEAKKNIHQNLIIELKKIAASIGTGSPKLEKIIKKEANKLAKKIAKEIQLDEAAILATVKTPNPEKASPAKAVATKLKTSATAKSAEKPAVKKGGKAEVVTAS
jgi:hypothetical protein